MLALLSWKSPSDISLMMSSKFKCAAGDIQKYYIAANEVEWDYAPHGMDMCGAKPANFSDDAAAVLIPNNYTLSIGSKQMKAIFEEYTDETFTVKKVCLNSLHPSSSWISVENGSWCKYIPCFHQYSGCPVEVRISYGLTFRQGACMSAMHTTRLQPRVFIFLIALFKCLCIQFNTASIFLCAGLSVNPETPIRTRRSETTNFSCIIFWCNVPNAQNWRRQYVILSRLITKIKVWSV